MKQKFQVKGNKPIPTFPLFLVTLTFVGEMLIVPQGGLTPLLPFSNRNL